MLRAFHYSEAIAAKERKSPVEFDHFLVWEFTLAGVRVSVKSPESRGYWLLKTQSIILSGLLENDMFLWKGFILFQLPDKKWGQQDGPKYYTMLNMEHKTGQRVSPWEKEKWQRISSHISSLTIPAVTTPSCFHSILPVSPKQQQQDPTTISSTCLSDT